MRDVWVIHESLRNTATDLIDRVPSWLLLRRTWTLHSDGDWHAVWHAAGVKDKWQNLLGNLQLRFYNGALLVSDKYQGQPHIDEAIEMAFTKIVKWRSFSSSRFGGVQMSCQQLVACELLGVPSLVEFAINDGASDFYIQGYNRLKGDVRKFVAVSALAGDAHLSILDCKVFFETIF